MKIKYRFEDGTKAEVEVDEELGLIIEEDERKYQNYERKCRYWCTVKLDDAVYEGEWFADHNTPAKAYELAEEERRVAEFKKLLTPTQLRRLEIRELDPSISFKEIAEMEGTNVRAVWETFEQIRKKHKLVFNDPQ